MVIAITGHRLDKLGREYDLKGPISEKIYKKLSETVDELKPSLMISGMALGVDMLWANVAIRKQIPWIAAIPCAGQESKWPESSQRLYRRMLADPRCERAWITDKAFTPGCMQKRNEWMVNKADLLIAVWDGTEGGTFNCVSYAVDKGKKILRIDPTDL